MDIADQSLKFSFIETLQFLYYFGWELMESHSNFRNFRNSSAHIANNMDMFNPVMLVHLQVGRYFRIHMVHGRDWLPVECELLFVGTSGIPSYFGPSCPEGLV